MLELVGSSKLVSQLRARKVKTVVWVLQVMSPASRVANQGSMVWLRTGVSSGNRPMFGTKMQKIPLAFWRVPAWTEYLEECRSGVAWESLGISEIAQQIR